MEDNAAVAHGPAMAVGAKIDPCQGHRNRYLTLNPGFPLIIRVDDMAAFSHGHNAIPNPGRIGEKIFRGQIRRPGRGFDDICKRKRCRGRPDHGKSKAGSAQSLAHQPFSHSDCLLCCIELCL